MKFMRNDTVKVKKGFHKGRIGKVKDYNFIDGYYVDFNEGHNGIYRGSKLERVKELKE